MTTPTVRLKRRHHQPHGRRFEEECHLLEGSVAGPSGCNQIRKNQEELPTAFAAAPCSAAMLRARRSCALPQGVRPGTRVPTFVFSADEVSDDLEARY